MKENKFKVGDWVFIDEEKIHLSYYRAYVDSWMKCLGVTAGDVLRISRIDGHSVFFENRVPQVWLPLDILTHMDQKKIIIPRSKEERMEIAKKVMLDLFSSDTRYQQYMKLYGSKI